MSGQFHLHYTYAIFVGSLISKGADLFRMDRTRLKFEKFFSNLLYRGNMPNVVAIYRTIIRRANFLLTNPMCGASETLNFLNAWIVQAEIGGSLKRLLVRTNSQIGHSVDTLSSINGLMESYLIGSISFEECTIRLSTWFESVNFSKIEIQTIFAIQRILESHGFFCFANRIGDELYIPLGRNRNGLFKWGELYSRFLFKIGNRDLVEACMILEDLKKLHGAKEPFGKVVIEELDHYLYLSSNGMYGERAVPVDTQFSALINGRDIVIVGPGIDPDINWSNISSGTLIIRFLKPGVTNWNHENPIGKHLEEIVYVNGQCTIWLQSLTDLSFLSRFKSVSFRTKSILASRLPNGRTIQTNHHLLQRGAPLILLYLLWDLSLYQPKSVSLQNFDFYALGEPYRKTSRPLSMLGSNVTEFNLCRSSAAHDFADNRSIMKNILKYRMFHASEKMSGVLEMSDADYMLRLEHNLGRNKL